MIPFLLQHNCSNYAADSEEAPTPTTEREASTPYVNVVGGLAGQYPANGKTCRRQNQALLSALSKVILYLCLTRSCIENQTEDVCTTALPSKAATSPLPRPARVDTAGSCFTTTSERGTYCGSRGEYIASPSTLRLPERMWWQPGSEQEVARPWFLTTALWRCFVFPT